MPDMTLGLAVKLASLVVHVQEMDPNKELDFDLPTAKALAADPEVAAWLRSIDPALLPVKR